MDITDYSAWSHDGQDWTEAFQRAIGAMKNQGGGELTVSPGDCPAGPIRPFFFAAPGTCGSKMFPCAGEWLNVDETVDYAVK